MMKVVGNFSIGWKPLILVALALLSYKNPNSSIHKDYFFRFGLQTFIVENSENLKKFSICATDSQNNITSHQERRVCFDSVISQQRLDFVLFSVETYYSLDYSELGEARQVQIAKTLGVLGNVILL